MDGLLIANKVAREFEFTPLRHSVLDVGPRTVHCAEYQHASQRSAYADAITSLSAAIDLLQRLPDGPERST
jgi:hypothetical protein